MEPLNKESREYVGARESDRRHSKLWYRGTLRVSDGAEPWVYVQVHPGLCSSAYDTLKGEGVDCQPILSMPHITVMRSAECNELKKKHGVAWRSQLPEGEPIRFYLKKMVSIVPTGWKKYERVWILECDSQDLRTLRSKLGFTPLPKADDGKVDLRFHITFAGRPSTIKAAEDFVKKAEVDAGLNVAMTAPVDAKSDVGSRLKQVFEKVQVDPEVNRLTLGNPYANAGVDTLLATTNKLLRINRGEAQTDDRDSLVYQTFHSPSDLFAERITKDAGQIGRKMLWKATLRGNLKHVPAGALTPQMRGMLLNSGLAQPIEELNPVEIYDQHLRVSRLGEGGIASLDAIPDSSRAVQPSHFGYIDFIKSPESSRIGVDQRLSYGTKLGKDGQLYTKLTNARTGKPEYVPVSTAATSVVAFPGEMKKDSPQVRAMYKAGRVEFVDRGDVDYELTSPSQMLTATANLVPLVSAIKGGRLLMGSKYSVQSLPLENPEAPLVRSTDGDGVPFIRHVGRRSGIVTATDKGVVEAVTADGITVRYADGTRKTHDLYNNFPMNRKSTLHNTALVKSGDAVAPGQILAKSNTTTDEGDLALGRNLRVAYMAWKGENFEDAISVSESAAKKLSSEHLYQHEMEGDDETELGRKAFVSIFPSKFTSEQLKKLDENGVVKPGTRVKYGDPLVLGLKKHKPTALHQGHSPIYTDKAITWEHEFDGVVTDAEATKDKGHNVTVKAYAPAQQADKLAGWFGDKGVIGSIIPDHMMPQTKDGKPLDILLNPTGIMSRVNPAQIYEALLGKVAQKTGKPIDVPGFMDESMVDYVKKQLQDNGLSDTEDLIDPQTGKKIPAVLTGTRYIMKLHHTSASKGSGRDTGAYTIEDIPARGGQEGSKRIALMENNALISHGAVNVLRDAKVIRGQRNDEYWRAFKLGYTPPSPKTPFVYEKFLSYLKGSGVNVDKRGSKLQLFALTDDDVDTLAAGTIKNPGTLEGDKLDPVEGGFFDNSLTGGPNGDRWSKMALSEPVPNPVMEEPIRRLLGLTQAQYEAVLSGEREILNKTGGVGVRDALSKIKIDDDIRKYEDIIKSGAKSRRDNAIKCLSYLKMMKENNIRPEKWVMTKWPVLPPTMRPIVSFQQMQLVSDPNYLYRDLWHANQDIEELRGVVSDKRMGKERLRLYNAVKAVSGLGDPIQAKTVEKHAKGLLQHVMGSSPKAGLWQRRVLGSPVDVVGRAAVIPNPDLDMDHVGIPEDRAWTIYRPFIVRNLVRRGMPAVEAAKAVANQTELARNAMLDELDKRPVLFNRAPTLHRYGFMAFKPVLVKGHALQVSPVVVAPFTLDFDGDQSNYHVPVSEDAVQEAYAKMLPSKNLHGVKDFGVQYLPRHEFMLGLHLASRADKDKKKDVRIFRSKKDVLDAYRRGELDLTAPVRIAE